jgi:hypothetical protein
MRQELPDVAGAVGRHLVFPRSRCPGPVGAVGGRDRPRIAPGTSVALNLSISSLSQCSRASSNSSPSPTNRGGLFIATLKER